MKAKQTADEFIIRETPGCLWLFGLFFVLVGGIFVYGALGGFKDHDRVPWWALAASFFMGSIAVGVGVWQIFKAPVTKIIVNRRTKKVAHVTRGLFNNVETIYDLEQIKQFRAVEDKDSEGDSVWYFAMEFTSGKIIRISSLPSHSEKYKRDLVFEANRFLDKQMPSYKSGFALGDESREKIS